MIIVPSIEVGEMSGILFGSCLLCYVSRVFLERLCVYRCKFRTGGCFHPFFNLWLLPGHVNFSLFLVPR